LREQGIDALSVYDVHQQGWTDAALLAYAASVPVLVRPANHPSPLEGEGRVRGNHCHQTKKPGIVGQVSRLCLVGWRGVGMQARTAKTQP